MRLWWAGKGGVERKGRGLLSQLLAEEMVARPMLSLSGQMTGHIHLPYLGQRSEYLPGHMSNASCCSPSPLNPP